ncbi:MAG: hydroxylase [Pseudomonadota bacterium]
MQIHYLEIVTTDVDAACASLAAQHGVTFSDPEPALGNARIASLSDGGRIGVRAPLAEHDTPIVRPYLLVDDIEAATKAAEAAGAEFAMKSTAVPGQGKFAIYFLGGVQYGLWER